MAYSQAAWSALDTVTVAQREMLAAQAEYTKTREALLEIIEDGLAARKLKEETNAH